MSENIYGMTVNFVEIGTGKAMLCSVLSVLPTIFAQLWWHLVYEICT